jgi:hypothetical protein
MQSDFSPITDVPCYTGRAQRADAFPQVAALAGTFTGTDLNSAAIVRLVLFSGGCLTYLGQDGRPDTSRTLSKPARLLLALLCEHVHSDRWKTGRAYVWTANDYLAMRMDLADARQVRRLLAELEEAGYIVRRYNGRNQRLDKQGIDLRPFGARIEALVAACARMDEMHELRRAERQAEFEDTADLSTEIPEKKSCVPDTNVRLESYKLQSADPKGSVDKMPSVSVGCKVRATDRIKVSEIFDLIVVASQTFRRHLNPEDQRLPTPSAISAAAIDILRSRFRSLRPDVWPAAVQSHGIGVAAAILALAVDKPGVSDPTRYLVGLLKRPEIGSTIATGLKALVRTAGSA